MVPQRLMLDVPLADRPLDKMFWITAPLEKHRNGTVKDLGPTAHVLLLPTHNCLFYRWGTIGAKVSLVIEEPTTIHGRYFFWLIFLQWRFFRVLSREAGNHPLILNLRFLQQPWNWVADRSDHGLQRPGTCPSSPQSRIRPQATNCAIDWSIGCVPRKSMLPYWGAPISRSMIRRTVSPPTVSQSSSRTRGSRTTTPRKSSTRCCAGRCRSIGATR